MDAHSQKSLKPTQGRVPWKPLAIIPSGVLLGLLLAVLLLLLLTPRPVEAGGVVGNGTPGSCTEAALDAALAGGGSVTFNCGAAPATIIVTSQKVMALNTTIDGDGLVTLSGGGSTRVITVSAGINLSLANLTIRQGSASDNGGGVYNRGKLTITNTQFINNTAALDGGAILNAPGGTVTITNSSLLSNAAGDDGGGLSSDGTAVVINSTFSANTATDKGGGLQNAGGLLTVVGSTVSNNATSASGGGLHNRGTLIVTSSQFLGNTAQVNGGALLNTLTSTVTISNSSFLGNSAQEDGGALFNTLTSTVTIHNSSFLTNTAGDDGGGLFNNSIGVVASSTFAYNTSNDKGGGIRNDTGPLTLSDSTLSGNTSNTTGGGIHNSGGGITLTHVTLYTNTGILSGGGLYHTLSGTVSVANSIVGGSPGGGDCVNDAGTFTGQGVNLDTDGSCVALSLAFTTTSGLNLAALADNGGGTLTHALKTGSTAIDAADNAFCTEVTDQRGATRPVNVTCDIGAYEYGAVPSVSTISPNSASALGPAFTLTVTGTKFIPGSVVLWDGSPRTTAFVSSTMITASIPASDLTTVGTFLVRARYGVAADGLSNSRNFTVTKANQMITFDPLPDRTILDSPFTVTGTASSGLALTFGASGQCTALGITVTLTAVGSCTVTAQQAGNATYNPAPSVPRTFTITKVNQTITFDPLPDRTILDSPFMVTGTASSGLALTFGASGQCTVSGITVTLTAVGSCTVTAQQAGNATYNPAPSVPRTFTITKVNQTITFDPLPNRTILDSPFMVTGTASSGLALTFGASGQCTVSGITVTLTAVGSCTVTASQAGDAIYDPASDVSQTFVITKVSQTIAFDPFPDKQLTDPPFTVTATASSGLTVTFTASGQCTVSGNTVTLTAVGSCTLTAHQAGDASYSAAPDVARTFVIMGAATLYLPLVIK